jgi:alpha-glucuronidase
MAYFSEYDCWLQARGTNNFDKSLAQTLSHIILDETGAIIDHAALELKRALNRCFGVSAGFSSGTGNQAVILGTIAHLNRAFSLGLADQKAEGFVIKAADFRIIVAGQDERGLLYGVYRLLSLLSRGKIVPGFELSDSPVAPFRVINHWDNIDGTVERGYAGKSLFFKDNRIEYDPARVTDYARLLSSSGINGISLSNVNVRGDAKKFITEEYLPRLAGLAAIFRPFGIRLILSVNFACPCLFGGLDTADPLDKNVAQWWKNHTDLIYRYIPDLAGFVVKADSEHEPGPFQYGRNHADGANMLADALKPHGGQVFWRCFVYNCTQDWRDQTQDRARAAYDHFMPLDGAFKDNVILQIKHGPYDFQVREPVSPLFGALRKTRHIMELQITQEYTGHQIDLCYLPWMWQDVLNFDTGCGEHARIRELAGNRLDGFAAVGNVGLDANWTGHTLAQANLFGYGALAWNPARSAADIAEEWSELTFGRGNAAKTIAWLLLASYPAYEKYNAPFGVCFMVTPHLHYGPSVEGYEFSKWGTYHRADRRAIGIDRTPSGTGFTAQYSPENAVRFADPAECPEALLLFFHRLPYDYRMKNGETLLQNIYSTHFEGCEEVKAMRDAWVSLKDELDDAVYESVKSRIEKQLINAAEWRDQVNTYFFRHTGIPDAKDRKIYE